MFSSFHILTSFNLSTSVGFWDTDVVSGHAVNSLPTPTLWGLPFPIVLYILAAVIFLIVFLFGGVRTRRRAMRVALFSFLLVGFLMALRMEFTWSKLFIGDLRSFSGTNTDERVAMMDGTDFYAFMKFVSASIPDGERVRHIDIDPEKSLVGTQVYQLGRYYLLPTLTSKRGRFVWTYNDPGVSFIPDTGRLDIYDSTFMARPYKVFRRGAVIFEIVEDGV